MKNSLKSTKLTYVILTVIGLIIIGLAVYAGIEGGNGGKKPKVTPTPTPSPTSAQQPVQNGDTTVFAVLLSVNVAESRIKAYIPETDEYIEFSYTGATDIKSAFGNVISANVLTPASIAEISFDSKEKRLYHLYLTNDYWKAENAVNWEYRPENSMMIIGGTNYRISKNVATISGDGEFSLSDVGLMDVINIYGMGSRVFAVELVLGHGTLYVMNESNFVGGSLFVDNVYAGQIEEGFAMAIREGTYEISFSKGDLNGRETISMNRDGTCVINLEPYAEEVKEYCYVDFRIKPDDAALYVDNYYYEHGEPVKLPYGTHTVEVTKKGYMTWSGTIEVGTETMKLPIELVEQFAATPTPSPEPTRDPEETPSPTPLPTESATPTPTYAPTPTPSPDQAGSVEVTMVWFPSSVITIDGNYVGTTDTSGTLKTTVEYGSHVIGLTRTTLDGSTVPRTYRITINADTPTYLSFPTTGS